MTTRLATHEDLDEWVGLRHQLWPDDSEASLRAGIITMLEDPDQAGFLAIDEAAGAVGFAEVRIHCGSSGPYGHLEGWYVAPGWRGRGLGRELIERVSEWCLHRAIRLLTSDTYRRFPLSPAAHERSGFETIHEFVIFMKRLQPTGSTREKTVGEEG